MRAAAHAHGLSHPRRHDQPRKIQLEGSSMPRDCSPRSPAILPILIVTFLAAAPSASSGASGSALAYGTYLRPTTFAGGDGLQNHGLAIAADTDGNAYIAGIV